MRALRRSSAATATVAAAATVAATNRVTASARTLPPVFPKPSPRGPPPASRRDRRPARDTLPGRNVRIAQLGHGGCNCRGRRPGHRQRPNAAAGFSMPPPRGPPPANRRDRRPARNAQPGRNAPLRGSMSAAATVAAPALATAGARTPPPIFPRSRRDGPARYFGRAPAHRGTPSQVRRSGCARSPMAAATVAAPTPAPLRPLHSVLDPPCALTPSRRLPNPRTGAGFPHNHRSPRFIRFPQPTPLWKTARGRRSCDVDPSQRRSGPVDMWKTCVA